MKQTKQTQYKPPRTLGWHHTHEELAHEFEMWGVRDWEARPNVMLSRANSSSLTRTERTVTVTFIKDNRTVNLALGDYDTPVANLKAIALCIRDMRMIERRGAAEVMASAFLQLAPPEAAPWSTLGISPGASREDIEAAYRMKAKVAHPDMGGSTEQMAALNRARDEALKHHEKQARG